MNGWACEGFLMPPGPRKQKIQRALSSSGGPKDQTDGQTCNYLFLLRKVKSSAQDQRNEVYQFAKE